MIYSPRFTVILDACVLYPAPIRDILLNLAFIELPDPGDRHVLAAGIKCKADAIITFNTKDFSTEDLAQYDIEVYTPDEFVNLLNKLNPSIVKQAFENQLASLKNPPVSKEKLIKTLVKCGLKDASKLFA